MQGNKDSRLSGYHFRVKKWTTAYELCEDNCEDSFDDNYKIVEIEKT